MFLTASLALSFQQLPSSLPSMRAHEILASAGIEPMASRKRTVLHAPFYYELRDKCIISISLHLPEIPMTRDELRAYIETVKTSKMESNALGRQHTMKGPYEYWIGVHSFNPVSSLPGHLMIVAESSCFKNFEVRAQPRSFGEMFYEKPAVYDYKLVQFAVESASRWLMSDLTDQKMKAKSWKNMAGRVTVHGDQSVSLQACAKARGHKLTVNLGEARAFVEGKGFELLIPLACPEVKLNGKWIPVPDITTAHGEDFQLPVNVIEEIEGK